MSNHPPNIIKQLPKAITHRIQTLSCNEEEFNKAIPAYHTALRSSGHQGAAPFIPPASQTPRRQRRRKIIWFNPPYSLNVSTNVGKEVLGFIDKHFPPHHKFAKLFNRSNVKVSYSCMPSMGAIIQAHNAKLLAPRDTDERTCSCRRPTECPVDGKCLTSSVIYKATITADRQPTKTYFGLAEGTFKGRYTNHMASFKHEKLRASTRLSQHWWSLADIGVQCNVKWEIAHKSFPYKCGSRRCDLCTSEKLAIAMADSRLLLNKRSEIVGQCRHRAKYKCKFKLSEM